MLIRKIKTAAEYRLQAEQVQGFLETVHDDDQLRTVLLDAAARLHGLAEEPDRSEAKKLIPKRGAKRRRSRPLLLILLQAPWAACWPGAL
jgi:hypothetical protein